ncbi:ankyrin repeat domain-containing protein [Sphingobacterium lactis]|uniref:ankyrin repeat domain-containing protein n=1 Tax=Sphingobacterium lactis TaxID=797291 RepID=UPI003DA2975C
MKKVSIIFGMLLLGSSLNFPAKAQDWRHIEAFYRSIFAGDTVSVNTMMEWKFIPPNFKPKNHIAPLEASIRSKDQAVYFVLLANGFTPGENKDELLLQAAEYGRLSILEDLLDKSASLETGAFNKAGFHAHYDCGKYLLMQGANQEIGDIRGKYWMFFEAVKRSDYDVLDRLQMNQADWDYNDCNGQTAIILSIKKQDATLLRYLLEKGANRDKPETFDCGDEIYLGKTPMAIAKQLKNQEMINLLKK